MGIWDNIFGSGIGAAADGVGSLAIGIREAIKGKEVDPMKQLELIAKAAETQGKVNAVEAQHRSIFVAGWRPFIGWVCGSALAYQFILRDFISYAMNLLGSTAKLPPSLDISQLISILLAMLGMAGYRTFEKIKKVN